MPKITLTFDADYKKIQSAIKEMTQGVDGVQKKISKSGGDSKSGGGLSLGKLLAGGALIGLTAGLASIAGKITSTVREGLTQITGYALESASKIESLQSSFDSISGGRGKEMTDMLTYLSMETGQKFDPLAQAANSVQAFTRDLEQTDAVLYRLSDIVGITRGSIVSLAEVYTRAGHQGYVGASELNQLMRQNVPIIEELTKKYGVNTVQLRKMASAGMIGFSELEDYINRVTSKGGMFEGGASKFAGTFRGSLNAMAAQLEAVFARVGKPLIDSLQPAFTTLVQIVEDLEPVMIKVAEAAAKIIGVIINSVRAIIMMVHDGSIWEAIKLSLIVAAKSFAAIILAGIYSYVPLLLKFGESLGQYLYHGGAVLLDMLTSGEFYSALLNVFSALAVSFVALILEALIDNELVRLLTTTKEHEGMMNDINEGYKMADELLMDAAKGMNKLYARNADHLKGVSDSVAGFFSDSADILKQSYEKASDKLNLGEDQQKLAGLFASRFEFASGSLEKAVRENTKQLRNPVDNTAAQSQKNDLSNTVSSFGKLGAGFGALGNIVTNDSETLSLLRETNRILTVIANKDTRAVYA